VTRNHLARRLSAAALAGVIALAFASIFSGSALADSLPASGCVTACTATFNTVGTTETLAIPAGISSLTATVSGAAGAEAPAFAVALAGAAASNGGVTTVDLGTTYAGQTLTLGVGDTGEGSYLQAGSALLVVAGGGGGAGYGGRLDLDGQISSTQPGGDGASPSVAGITSGADADVFGVPSVNGGGGTTIGGTAGIGNDANGANGSATTTTTGAGSTLAAGGVGPTSTIDGNLQVSGSGGTGYTGGGAGGRTTVVDSDDNPTDIVGGGGGGSGFLASGLTGTPGDPNTSTGSVVLTWSFTPTISTTTTTAHRGDTVPVTITGLPADEAFTVTFDGTTVVTDTSDGSGNATESFVVGSGQTAGNFALDLVAGGGTVATSDPVAVIVVLAATGSANPILPGTLAALVILGGAAAILLAGRREKKWALPGSNRSARV
jgi:hypothetical protein